MIIRRTVLCHRGWKETSLCCNLRHFEQCCFTLRQSEWNTAQQISHWNKQKTINITSKVNIWTVYCWRKDKQKQKRLFFETPGKLRPVLTKHNETAIMLLQPLDLYLQAWKHFAAMQIENRGFKFYDVAPKTKLGKRYWLLS